VDEGVEHPPSAADPVTGAVPRALLHPLSQAALDRAGRDGTHVSLFLFDVDFFKTVNDAYGHLRGDEVLYAIAERVRGASRAGDTLFRYGGDEFVLLLPDTDRAAALPLALRLTEEVKGRPFPGDPPLTVSISLGVATYPDDGADARTLLSTADRRNYLAKRRGRGGAVADDVDTGGDSGSSRVWERESALNTVHEFMTWLQAEGRGALEVRGPAGVGHTRFLAEVRKVAALRGFTVVSAADPVPADHGPVLVLADVGDRATLPAHGPVGLVYATVPTDRPVEYDLPLRGTVDLVPWSPAALRIWLRATLRGEPSRSLFSWLSGRSRGLPARAERELAVLRERGGLVPHDDGSWTIAPHLLERPRRRGRLPVPMTPLVGRRAEQDRVVALLRQGRLVTLVGPGGIGKTRLSLAVAATVSGGYEDGAVFVPLADATDTDQMVAGIARALNVAEVPGQPLLDTVLDQLAEAALLLVLDNFEQIVDASSVIGELLSAAPGISALATSRERLSVYGEQVYPVPPLPVPELDRLPATASGVAQAVADSPALALFEQRALAAGAPVGITPQTLPAVARLCHLLDGLPLAIELAAATADRWRAEDLVNHLANHLAELGGGARDLPERQRTLRGAIDWSFVLLDPPARYLFTRLAVFAGGFDRPAVQAVASRCDTLDTLVAKNLVVLEQDGRYRMLETIRAYAVAKLAVDPSADEVYARHAEHFLDLAEDSATGLTGPEQTAWAERLELEYQNLRAAMHWTLHHEAVEQAARICLGLWRYWRNGSHLREGREWLDAVLSTVDGLPPGLRARILHPAAILAATQDDHAAAVLYGKESLALAESVGDRTTAAHAHNALGIAAIGAGEYTEATGHFRESLALWQELEQSIGTAMALGNLTKLSLRIGDIAAANGYADRCLALERAAGNTRGILLALECLGQIRLAEGDVPGARTALEESLALSRTLGDAFGEAMSLHQLGLAADLDGDRPEALRLLVTALRLRHEVGDREDLAVSLDRVAALVAGTDPTLAVRFLGAAEELRERHRLPTPPEADTRRAQTLAATREALDAPAFGTAWSGGRNAPLDLIVDQATELAG
jgi:diguanylate cyclase (GGDEF)-like protein